MSITEWVLETYNTDDNGLEEAKNFTFIWSLFENQSSKNIFTDKMQFSKFKLWVNKLDIKRESVGILIRDEQSGNEINGNLVDAINKSFNHFYQKYKNNEKLFLDTLFNQRDEYTLSSKKLFERLAKSININNIRDKILFLFLVAKRMRNKFFHGIKNIGDIKSDHKEFKKINEYLISIISLIETYN
ncbi:hypothetical protein CN554_13125 [Bacillus wiedmannii]|uniref:hypothetical protein n=1 Tax=Bacillus wiedmannii TaxID=1890302 RepID=UPI0007DAFE20|nr:hypothetical protein [Bacillus wiedmannii]OAK17203.1 hypothetical protein A6281_08655 [Bacillus wiedmannii]PEO97599.1 hypothetical protein CN554_13125 [Bacillus wiedmannii]